MKGRPRLPFLARRPLLLLRDLTISRRRPPLDRLARTRDPERFLWRILPHAARTFSACIILLPERLARATAVAYLYCRMLDTYEDLVGDPRARDAALAAFAARFGGGDAPRVLGPAPGLVDPVLRDAADAAYALLVRCCGRIDAVFETVDPPVRAMVVDLVREMAASMRWSSGVFAAQGGTLLSDEQLSRYCYGVLGTTVLFNARLFRHHLGASDELSPELREHAIRAGEFLQLANVTRDIEKDLRRGVSYHPLLADHLGSDAAVDAAARAAVVEVRKRLLERALELAPSYRRLVELLPFRRLSLHRASAVLMLLFTERYYRRCARRCGREATLSKSSGSRLMLRAFRAFWSPRAAQRLLELSERRLLTLRTTP